MFGLCVMGVLGFGVSEVFGFCVFVFLVFWCLRFGV